MMVIHGSASQWLAWRQKSPQANDAELHHQVIAFLCGRLLQAYFVPDLRLVGPGTTIFMASFWRASGMKVAECLSWGLLVHAALHVVKDVILFHLLATPEAVRWVMSVYVLRRPVCR